MLLFTLRQNKCLTKFSFMNHTQYITVSISVAVIVMIFSFPGIFEGEYPKQHPIYLHC